MHPIPYFYPHDHSPITKTASKLGLSILCPIVINLSLNRSLSCSAPHWTVIILSLVQTSNLLSPLMSSSSRFSRRVLLILPPNLPCNSSSCLHGHGHCPRPGPHASPWSERSSFRLVRLRLFQPTYSPDLSESKLPQTPVSLQTL